MKPISLRKMTSKTNTRTHPDSPPGQTRIRVASHTTRTPLCNRGPAVVVTHAGMKTNQNTFISPGGKHRPAIGLSTTDQTDKQREAEAVESFNQALQQAITEQFGQVPW